MVMDEKTPFEFLDHGFGSFHPAGPGNLGAICVQIFIDKILIVTGVKINLLLKMQDLRQIYFDHLRPPSIDLQS